MVCDEAGDMLCLALLQQSELVRPRAEPAGPPMAQPDDLEDLGAADGGEVRLERLVDGLAEL
eukprot:m.99819 g.99819  ORF g.99819 m.99819 type:complete len:62 (-) comp8910_c0_seq4:234-419(-)